MLRASDIDRVALLMTERHGSEAARRSQKRAEDLRSTEPRAAESWLRVVEAIRRMEAGAA